MMSSEMRPGSTFTVHLAENSDDFPSICEKKVISMFAAVPSAFMKSANDPREIRSYLQGGCVFLLSLEFQYNDSGRCMEKELPTDTSAPAPTSTNSGGRYDIIALIARGWTWLWSSLATLFTVKVGGLGVPIAVTVLLALAPIIILYQQNRLVSLQEQITESQTELMQLQTLAETSNLSRALFQDLTDVVNLIARVEAARKVYKEVRDTTVSVKSRINAPKSLFFDDEPKPKTIFWIFVEMASLRG
jgi:hypothetical protein